MAASSLSSSTFQGFQGLRADSSPAQASASNVRLPAATRSPAVTVVAEKKVVKKKQIILTKNVPNVGSQGDLIAVRLGFFRNYLFPQGLAKTATPQVLRAIKEEQERQERERLAVLDAARKLARQFQTIGGFTVRRKAGAGKAFFGSVTKLDLVDIIKANTGKDMKKDDIELPEIKEVGEYVAQVKLHPEVIAEVRINVVGK